MKGFRFIVLGLIAVSACQKKGKLSTHIVTKTRSVSVTDVLHLLGATSKQQFMPPEEPLKSNCMTIFEDVAPSTWKAKPKTAFRMLNYQASQSTEVYVSLVGGSLLNNLNRWRSQFALEALTAEQLNTLPTLPFLAGEGVLIEFKGKFKGMGEKEVQKKYCLLGLLAEHHGQLVAIKMVGPSHEVMAQKKNLLRYIKSLKDTSHEHE